MYALGTNAALRGDLLAQNLIDSAEGEPMYILTIPNPYPLQDMNNEVFSRLAKDNPNVGIIDWWAATEGHPEYLVDDRTHPTEASNEVLANLYKQALCGR